MAQTCYFFDGTATGDATAAPYDDAELAAALDALHGCDFVIADYGNHFEPHYDGSNYMDTLGTGAAFIQGTLYILDAATACDPAAQGGGLNRYDRIVLRRDAANQTAAITIIQGTPNASPTIPALTADDLSLYVVYVPDTYGGATIERTTDERVMWSAELFASDHALANHVQNGEFMAYSQGHVGTVAPEYWSASATTCQKAAAFGTQVRGHAVTVTNGTLSYFSPLLTTEYQDADGNPLYTLKAVVNTDAIVTVSVYMYEDATGGLMAAKNITKLNTNHEFIWRFALDLDAGGRANNRFEIRFTVGGGVTFKIGQLMLCPGYVPGPPRIKREILMYNTALTDAGHTDNTDTDDTVDFSTEFNANVPRGVEHAIVRASYYNTSSSTCSQATGDPASLYIGQQRIDTSGMTNSAPIESIMYAALTKSTAWGFRYQAGDAASADNRSTIRIVGIMT